MGVYSFEAGDSRPTFMSLIDTTESRGRVANGIDKINSTLKIVQGTVRGAMKGGKPSPVWTRGGDAVLTMSLPHKSELAAPVKHGTRTEQDSLFIIERHTRPDQAAMSKFDVAITDIVAHNGRIAAALRAGKLGTLASGSPAFGFYSLCTPTFDELNSLKAGDPTTRWSYAHVSWVPVSYVEGLKACTNCGDVIVGYDPAMHHIVSQSCGIRQFAVEGGDHSAVDIESLCLDFEERLALLEVGDAAVGFAPSRYGHLGLYVANWMVDALRIYRQTMKDTLSFRDYISGLAQGEQNG
jgi:hypothetical protein